MKFPGREGGTGPLENAIVFMLLLLLPRLGRCPNPVGKDEQALGRKMRGSRYGGGLGEAVSPSNGPQDVKTPPAQAQAATAAYA